LFTAIKTFSQVCTHMSIAFGLAYLLTGSLALGGLAAIIEPIINVGLLPWHEKPGTRSAAAMPPAAWALPPWPAKS